MTMDLPVAGSWQDGQQEERPSLGCSPFLVLPLAVALVAAALGLLAFQRPVAADVAWRADAATGAISNIFMPEVQYWNGSIRNWAGEANIDANLVAVVMQIESCGSPTAVSSAGATGLFQVMPYHFLESDDAFSPDTNAQRALDYLGRSLAAAKGDIGLALAGYNGGIGLISEPEWTWPAETQRYSYWGTGIYADAVSGAKQSPRLEEWLAAGGAALCQDAAVSLGTGN